MSEGRKGLNSDVILKAAIDIVDQKGASMLTMKALATKLNVQSPSLYNHINGIEGLKESLYLYGLKELYKALVDVSIGRSGDEAVLELGFAYLTFARNHPGVYLSTLTTPPNASEKLQEAAQAIVTLIQRVLQVYDLPDEDTIHAIRGLRSLLHGFATLAPSGGFALNIEVEESLQFSIETFLQGLRRKKKEQT